ncbi:MAG: bifunctional NADP-dependent methylenetetrahydromethanopterin dehydrogenase/methylenetetrahydrofolate dehydrogenase, partial [Planctomycetota bacterium]
AAVLAAGAFEGEAAVLGLGPVGSRVAALLENRGTAVRTFDPSPDRGGSAGSVAEAVEGASALFACGPAGIELIAVRDLKAAGVRIAMDLNAVPPAGVARVEPQDAGTDRDGVRCFGALAVGGLKMKIHAAAVASLFEANDRTLGAEELMILGRDLLAR